MIYWRYSRSTRFGNWLFQYGVAKTLAHGGDVAFYVDPAFDSCHVDGLLKRGEVMRGIKVVRELPPDAKLLDGVPQCVRQLDEALVRDLYKVPERVDAFIRAQYKDILAAPLRVSVHVRRGDYLRLPHRHPFVGKDYLRRAVGEFPEEALYVVCSDDLPWCKAFFTTRNFPGRRFAFVEGGDVLSDMYVATYCDHNIMSNSTFSWWGAYLNQHQGKRVIMPSNWFGMEIGKEMSRKAVESLRYEGVEVMRNCCDFFTFSMALVFYMKTKVGDCLRVLHLRS